MKSIFNICFYAKKDKQKANGAYPLFARITVDGVASRFNTKLDVLPSIWDGKMGKATGRTSEASRINRMLNDIASLNTIYHEMQRRDNYVTAEKVKNEFLDHSESHETILSLFQKHNNDVKQLVGISKSSSLCSPPAGTGIFIISIGKGSYVFFTILQGRAVPAW